MTTNFSFIIDSTATQRPLKGTLRQAKLFANKLCKDQHKRESVVIRCAEHIRPDDDVVSMRVFGSWVDMKFNFPQGMKP